MLAAHRGTAGAAGLDWKSAVYRKVQEEVKVDRGLTIERMLELGRVSRSGFYRYEAEPAPEADAEMDLRDAIQRIAVEMPSYGRRRITAELRRRGWQANPKRVYRLMRDDNLLCVRRRKFVLLAPLYQRLKRHVLASKVVGTDDTPVKVLDRKLKRTRKGRIWPYVGDRDHAAVIYDYTATRERAGPEEFLRTYRGYLQADAYVAYDSFFIKPERGMIEVACMAHARRHIYQALDYDPSRMRTVLLLIAQLYRVEARARRHGIVGQDLRLLRQQGARPVLDKLAVYLREIREQLLPKSEAGQAVNYLLKNWAALTRYCDNPDLSIDNNHTERSLRGWAVGRANWTFFGSDRGGKTAAVLRSFVASCELLKIDPFAWFHDVLSRIADHPVTRLDELLPHRWSQAQP